MESAEFQQHNQKYADSMNIVAPENNDILDIIYQDEYLVAINKPAGLLVHRSPIDRHETRFAVQLLRNQLNQWVYPVHRLDKPTSGLLLFALSPEIAEHMGRQIMAHQLKKQYWAIVRGHPLKGGIIRHPIKETAAFKHQKKTVEAQVPKPALTVYQRLNRWELPISDGRHATSRYALVKLAPVSGRKHQLRKHLKHLSHPIIGDVKYGKGPHNRLFQEQFDSHRLLLAATQARFTHPVSGQPMIIHCPLEANFEQTLTALGRGLDN